MNDTQNKILANDIGVRFVSCVRIQRSHKKKTNNKPKQTQIDQTKQQRYISNLNNHTLINNKNMVAYNSKYIYPFGGSAEVPEEDPDKQIGEYIICSISMCIFIRSNTIQ